MFSVAILVLKVFIFLRSDFRQAGRDSCSNQQHPKLARSDVLLNFEISDKTSAVIKLKEMDMKKYESTRSTSTLSINLAVRFKAKFIALFTATSLVAMSGIGDHSA